MQQRFRHILLPVNFTEKNEAALEIALEAAIPNRSRVTLLHVIERIGKSEEEPDEEIERFYTRLEQRAESSLVSLCEPFAAAGVEIAWKIRLGKRVAEVVHYATEHGVDLMILSSHPVNPQEPMKSWSTISYQVSLLCSCSVLLVK